MASCAETEDVSIFRFNGSCTQGFELAPLVRVRLNAVDTLMIAQRSAPFYLHLLLLSALQFVFAILT